MSIIDLFLKVKISFFKVIRLFRVLRPLRIISKNEGLRISIQALIISIPAVFNVIMITFPVLLNLWNCWRKLSKRNVLLM